MWFYPFTRKNETCSGAPAIACSNLQLWIRVKDQTYFLQGSAGENISGQDKLKLQIPNEMKFATFVNDGSSWLFEERLVKTETDEKILCNPELVETEMVIHISKHGKLLHGIGDCKARRTLKITNEK